MNSFELLSALKNAGYLKNERELLWWPKSGSFEVVVGAILTQQTRWEKVEKSLNNLRDKGVLNLEELAQIDPKELSLLIKPSGFYNTKAKNIKLLSQNIQKEFSSFENFTQQVEREWLLSQKGVGPESCDSILCYACKREIMVVDSYTNRLLSAFGYEFESYDALQEWLEEGIFANLDAISKLYGRAVSVQEVFARFHGKIVEFCKEKMRGKSVDVEVLGLSAPLSV